MNIINFLPVAKNLTEVQVAEVDHPALQGIVQILVSYETPVVVKSGLHIFVTDQFHSRTTNRHIANWLERYPGVPAENVHKIPQWALDEVLAGGEVWSVHYTLAVAFVGAVAS